MPMESRGMAEEAAWLGRGGGVWAVRLVGSGATGGVEEDIRWPVHVARVRKRSD